MPDTSDRGDSLRTGEQPRHPGVAYKGDDPPGGQKKPYKEMTPYEHWLQRRNRWLKVMPGRLATVEAAFNNLLKVANQEYYEFTDDETKLLVARLRAWVEALDISCQGGKPLFPTDLPPVTLDRDLRPPALGAPPGLEDIW